MKISDLSQAGRARWAALQPRERTALQGAAAVLGLVLLWTVALAPALRILRDAPLQHARLDVQLQRMQALGAQAEALKNEARAEDSANWRERLAASLEALGSAELGGSGQVAVVQIKSASPQALGRWLAELGLWQLQVRQASLQQNKQGQWQGQLTLQHP